jgi:hypothetical protein
MSRKRERDAGPTPVALEEPAPPATDEAERRALSLLEHVAATPGSQGAGAVTDATPAGLAATALLRPAIVRTAQPVGVAGGAVRVRVRGVEGEICAELAPGVERELVEQAVRNGDRVVLECAADEPPAVVGVLQTRSPREVVVKGAKIHLEAEEELLLRAGRGAMRIRRDGDIELVGSRIAAMSRGLFRLVGRVLRLN